MRPLIFDFKTPRTEDESPIGYSYDSALSLNVISVNGTVKPFIEVQHNDIELLTKTKVEREKDDDSYLLELGTKTEASRERDDRHDSILELATKTLVSRESDDQRGI